MKKTPRPGRPGCRTSFTIRAAISIGEARGTRRSRRLGNRIWISLTTAGQEEEIQGPGPAPRRKAAVASAASSAARAASKTSSKPRARRPERMRSTE